MKVLFLTRLYAPHVGGVEKHIYELSRVLSKKNDITIVTEQFATSLKTSDSDEFTLIYRIPVKMKKYSIWKWFFNNLELIRNADVVHIHDFFFWYLPFRLLFPFKKVFITFHGYEGANPPELKQVFWHRLAAYLCRGNICIGDFHSKWYGVTPDYVSYGATSQIKSVNNHFKNSAIFIGRPDPDTGFLKYQDVAKKYHLKLDSFTNVPNAAVLIPKYEYAFVSRYLAIVESLFCGIPVLAEFNNQIKYDYLNQAPFAKYIKIFTDPNIVDLNFSGIDIKAGQRWAKNQTWQKLADIYEKLWQK